MRFLGGIMNIKLIIDTLFMQFTYRNDVIQTLMTDY